VQTLSARSKVVVLRCESYETQAVRSVVKKGIDLLGGAGAFAGKGEKILLKPNWLAPDPPEKCTTTHPMVFKAVAETLKESGAILTYGDSPAFHAPLLAAQKTGFRTIAEELAIHPADFDTGSNVFFNNGLQNKKFLIANGVLDCDGVISLPKLKTHGFQGFTGCVKNQFGCIPGPAKGEFHVKTQDVNSFAKMLVDLDSFVKPRLYVMDAIYAMEGNGPRGGNRKKLGALLFSTDPIALDATACRIIDCNPEFIPTIMFGKAAGRGVYAAHEIELIGDPLDTFVDNGFDIKREPAQSHRFGKVLHLLKNVVIAKPYIISKKCISCGACIKACPVNPKAIKWRSGNNNKVPSYNYSRCIRCFCCQELCPESAIRLKVPILRKTIFQTFFNAARIRSSLPKK
jgi:uncharacterized protein (DUF362 family)/Pyruvate/2-oxoacid:ferredoxin oxidoreductase delta subunit